MFSWDKKKVVVTGAGGFIGSHLVERLLELGAQVTAFVRYNSRNDAGVLEYIGEKKRDLRIVSGEIRELETVRNLVRGADAEVIFHLAALVGIPSARSGSRILVCCQPHCPRLKSLKPPSTQARRRYHAPCTCSGGKSVTITQASS